MDMYLYGRYMDTNYIPTEAKCRDCDDDDPMLVEFTEQNGKRLYMCRECFETLGEEVPNGLLGGRIVSENPEKTPVTS